ncbi:nucleolar protein 12-like isoform X2 [Rhododendron vialii]|uniref:nucleolar protein 12-like isoform X2 n=1 Tax=Rhododendron vialii TaxID=182163 RepID=UPI00265EBCE6|nr:nucleolar protein 12-like isoform X2 [Rhododendron vialii]
MTERKKRKRDEIEAEYKERRSGAMGMNEGGGGGGLRERVVGEKRKHVDDPVDMMMVPKDDGSDDEAILLRTVFVGNLQLKVKKKVLVKEFSQFGEIESIRIQSCLCQTKIPRKGAVIQKKTSDAVDSVHAYVVFKTEEAAQASLANDMALVGGNHVCVDRACPPRKKLKRVDATLYDNKRTAFVGNLPFDVKGGANLVCKKRSLRLRKCELRLYHARSNLTPSKRKHSSPGEGEDSNTKKLAVDLRTSDNGNKVKTKSGSSHQGLWASTSGASEQAGKKRKLESQTPESYRSNKKLRKLR